MATTEKRKGGIAGFNFSEKECIWMRAKSCRPNIATTLLTAPLHL